MTYCYLIIIIVIYCMNDISNNNNSCINLKILSATF